MGADMNILDVSEGMYGSSYGPGWLRSGLPVKNYDTPPGSTTSSKTYTFWEGLTGSYTPPGLKNEKFEVISTGLRRYIYLLERDKRREQLLL